MNYTNPVLHFDFSEPDVIRVGENFYMVASSFNHVPGVPVLHSKNLVEWRIINHVMPEIPFERFNAVQHGNGAWAPSIRYHGGKYYCLIPFPDEGIYVSETTDPYGEWSPIRPLVEGKGLEDPCPIWVDGRCFVVFAFAKSRAGVNSQLAVFETNEDLTVAATKFTVVYDGHNDNPVIEGPKFYRRGKYFYILAPAGGVGSGWQVALRSTNIYGPYETKIIMMQGETDINGPHQGALIDLDDGGEKWAFMHLQDKGAYGRVVHLQPVVWLDEWPVCGNVPDELLPGYPVAGGEYPVDILTDYKIDPSDEFDGDGLRNVWQTPANPSPDWWQFKHGLKLNCTYYGADALSDVPQLIMQKVPHLNFAVKSKCKLNLVNDGDEAGFVMFGKTYAYVCVVRQGGQNYLEIREGKIGGSEDETLCRSQLYDDNYVTFQVSAKYEERNRLTYKFTFGKVAFTHKFYAERGIGTGAKMGVYARANTQSKGSATFKFFRVVCTDKRVSKE